MKKCIYIAFAIFFMSSQAIDWNWYAQYVLFGDAALPRNSKFDEPKTSLMIDNAELDDLKVNLKSYEDCMKRINWENLQSYVDLIVSFQEVGEKISFCLQKSENTVQKNDVQAIADGYKELYENLMSKIDFVVNMKKDEVKKFSSSLKYRCLFPLHQTSVWVKYFMEIRNNIDTYAKLEKLSKAASDSDMQELNKKINWLMNKFESTFDKAYQKFLFSLSVLTNVCVITALSGYVIYKKWFAKKR